MSGFRGIPRIVPEPINSPWIVRAKMVDAHGRANDIVARAESRAEELRAEAVAQAGRVCEAARQEGLREGAKAAAALIAEVSAGLEAHAAAREADASRLALAIARRILGEFEENERIIRAVKTALDEQRGTKGLRLRVSPLMQPVLRAALDEHGSDPWVALEVDERASSDACTMIHPRGRIAIGPLDQLQTLDAAVERENHA